MTVSGLTTTIDVRSLGVISGKIHCRGIETPAFQKASNTPVKRVFSHLFSYDGAHSARNGGCILLDSSFNTVRSHHPKLKLLAMGLNPNQKEATMANQNTTTPSKSPLTFPDLECDVCDVVIATKLLLDVMCSSPDFKDVQNQVIFLMEIAEEKAAKLKTDYYGVLDRALEVSV